VAPQYTPFRVQKLDNVDLWTVEVHTIYWSWGRCGTLCLHLRSHRRQQHPWWREEKKKKTPFRDRLCQGLQFDTEWNEMQRMGAVLMEMFIIFAESFLVEPSTRDYWCIRLSVTIGLSVCVSWDYYRICLSVSLWLLLRLSACPSVWLSAAIGVSVCMCVDIKNIFRKTMFYNRQPNFGYRVFAYML